MNEKILQIINAHPINTHELRRELSIMNMVDIGAIFDALAKDKTIQIFRLLPKDIAANVFAHIETDKQQIIVEALTDNEVGHIIEGLFSDDAADFIEEMPANVVNRVLRSVSDEKRATINQLLQYPDDSVGSIMTTEYMTLREDFNLIEAFAEIREKKMKGLHTCYIVRRDKLLVGSVTLKTLLLAKEHERIGDIMRPTVISAQTLDDQEKAARLFRKYDLLSLPVVDKEGRMVGIITVDDAVEIVEEETTEDFEKMAAILPTEDPYLKIGVFKHAYKRVGWLLILMLAAIFTELVIADAEDFLARMPVLLVFMPMLMDMGGNVGSQTSTLIIRSMALDEIVFRDVLKVWWREFRVAALCGVLLSVLNALRIIVFNREDDVFFLTLTVSLTLVTVIILSKSLGCLLPMTAKKLRLDPAVLATPIIKTLADVVALVMYFAIAAMLLPGLRG
ncbi:MAG: magnesium transporter [Defluviitaleaceae bacterium]|nr:magnesium transporter [Defluviitaleaceae bacterium]